MCLPQVPALKPLRPSLQPANFTADGCMSANVDVTLQAVYVNATAVFISAPVDDSGGSKAGGRV